MRFAKPITILTALALGLLLGACSVQSSTDNPAKESAREGKLELRPFELTPEEATYQFNYPKYPQQYTVDPLDRAYMSGRTDPKDAVAELGSYAGPWIEGAEAELMPVSAPNVNLGDKIAKAIGSSLTANMKPSLEDSPLQAFLKVRAGLERAGLKQVKGLEFTLPASGDKITADVPLDKEAIWSLTFSLYKQLEPDWRIPIASRLNPGCETDKDKCKAGDQLFVANCGMCHGSDGWGRGHSGQMLQPHPANFHERRRLYNRSEARLRVVLHQGIYGSAMPPWGDKLSDTEINHLVAYIRSFSYTSEPYVPAKVKVTAQ
jgi:mono/diheme cytochrome c family protein